MYETLSGRDVRRRAKAGGTASAARASPSLWWPVMPSEIRRASSLSEA